MRTTSHIFEWRTTREEGATLSDPTKLTQTQTGAVALQAAPRPVPLPGRARLAFPTDTDLFVRTKGFAPTSLVSFDFIQPMEDLPLDENGAAVTSLAYRAFDGTDPMYWDGGAWVVATDDDLHWNTLTDFNANLPTYAEPSLAIEVRLGTTDTRFTPSILCIFLRWTAEVVSILRDLIYNGLVVGLKNALRPWTEYVDASFAGGSTYDLTAFPFDSKLVVDQALAIYDFDTDPGLTTDLVVSQLGSVVTLSSTLSATRLFVRASYTPIVAVTTSTDYTEKARVPAIWLTSITADTAQKALGGTGPSAIDPTLAVPAGTVFLLPITLRDLTINGEILAANSNDLVRLNETFESWLKTHPTIRMPALDLEVRVEPGPVLVWNTAAEALNDLRVSSFAFTLKDVPLFDDVQASAADTGTAGSTAVPAGPIDAGDPAFPGVGFGVKKLKITFEPAGSIGSTEVVVIPPD